MTTKRFTEITNALTVLKAPFELRINKNPVEDYLKQFRTITYLGFSKDGYEFVFDENIQKDILFNGEELTFDELIQKANEKQKLIHMNEREHQLRIEAYELALATKNIMIERIEAGMPLMSVPYDVRTPIEIADEIYKWLISDEKQNS